MRLHCLNDFTYFIENNFTGKNLGHYDFFCTKVKIVYYKWHVTSFVMHSKKEKYLPDQKGSHKSLYFLFPSAGSQIYSNFGKSHYIQGLSWVIYFFSGMVHGLLLFMGWFYIKMNLEKEPTKQEGHGDALFLDCIALSFYSKVRFVYMLI